MVLECNLPVNEVKNIMPSLLSNLPPRPDSSSILAIYAFVAARCHVQGTLEAVGGAVGSMASGQDLRTCGARCNLPRW